MKKIYNAHGGEMQFGNNKYFKIFKGVCACNSVFTLSEIKTEQEFYIPE